MIVSHFIYKPRVDNIKKQPRNTEQPSKLPLPAESPCVRYFFMCLLQVPDNLSLSFASGSAEQFSLNGGSTSKLESFQVQQETRSVPFPHGKHAHAITLSKLQARLPQLLVGFKRKEWLISKDLSRQAVSQVRSRARQRKSLTEQVSGPLTTK